MDRVKPTIIVRSKTYALVENTNDVMAYAVFKYTPSGFWYQVSPSYYRKGNAMRAYKRAVETPTVINQPLN